MADLCIHQGQTKTVTYCIKTTNLYNVICFLIDKLFMKFHVYLQGVECNQDECVNLLLYLQAVECNQDECVNLLLYLQAVECNQDECVNLLLEYKAEVDVRDQDSNTALHIAVKEGLTNIVALLIRYGANVNLKNKVGGAGSIKGYPGDNIFFPPLFHLRLRQCNWQQLVVTNHDLTKT